MAVTIWSGPAAAENAVNVIDVVVAAAYASDAAAIRDDLEEMLGRMGVTARYREAATIDPKQVLRPDPDAPPALARVWLDLAAAGPDRAVVYLADTKWQRVLVRHVGLSAGLDEVARQEVSVIVASSVDALRSGSALGAGKEGDVILQAERPGLPLRGRGLWLTAGATAASERWSRDQTVVAALGLSVTLGLGQRRPEPALWINAAYHEATAAGDPVSLRLRGGSLAVLGLVGFGVRRASFRLGAGPGADLISAAPTAAAGSSGVRLDPARWLPSIFIRAAARADYRISRSILVFVAALCDVQVATNRYVTARPPDPAIEPVFQPSLLRPSVMLGVEASILGGAK
ncbi:MAG TPA: hypothetical protein VFH73_20670 [Polyangia bacterium]|nr:hypothetical protein [Polyangia bacterium]